MLMRKQKLAVAVAMALTLAGCMWSDDTPSHRSQAPGDTASGAIPGGENTDPNGSEEPSTDPADDGDPDPAPGSDGDAVSYYVVASDNEGYVNLLSGDAAGDFRYAAGLRVANTVGAAAGGVAAEAASPDLGDVMLRTDSTAAAPRAYVVIRNGLLDEAGTPIGGGYGVIDVDALIADPATAPSVSVHALQSQLGEGARLSDLTHLIPEVQADGSSSHCWMMNEGPTASVGASAAERTAARQPDSVFRVNWDHADTADSDGSEGLVDDAYGDRQEIAVGDGQKAAVIAAIDATQNFVFVHNTAGRSVSVIDNVSSSPTFQQVVRTIDLGTGRKPRGMAFSPVSGHAYVGIPNNKTVGLGIIDAAQTPDAMTTRFLPVGTGAGQVPGSHSFAVSPSGRWVFAASYQQPSGELVGQGFLTVIDAALADAVTVVRPLGDMKPGKIDVAAIDVDGADLLRLFVSSAEGGADDSIVAVIDFDPEAGAILASSALEVGPAAGTRRSALSADNRWIFFSASGSCDASTPVDEEPGAEPVGDPGVDGGDDTVTDNPGTDGGGVTGGVDLGLDEGIDIGLALARARSVDVGVDIGLDPDTDPGVDTGNGTGSEGVDGEPDSSDPDTGTDSGLAPTCATIIPVDVLTQEVGDPLRTLGDSVRGLAVYVAGSPAPDVPAPDEGTDESAPPGDGGGDSTPPDEGTDGSLPPDDGGSSTPPDEGSTPPDEGSGDPVPGDGTDTPPDEGTDPPPDTTDPGSDPSFDDVFR